MVFLLDLLKNKQEITWELYFKPLTCLHSRVQIECNYCSTNYTNCVVGGLSFPEVSCSSKKISLSSKPKFEKKLLKLIESYKDKAVPTLPIDAKTLMIKYNIPEGKMLGNKLKLIEETWVHNSFQISDKQIQKLIKAKYI